MLLHGCVDFVYTKRCFLCQNANLIFVFPNFFFPLQTEMNTGNPILTITGSDSTSGSGVQADIKVISALGGYAVSAITSITVQNTLGIQEFFDVPAEIVSGQMEAIINDMQPPVVKIGMIRRVDVLKEISEALNKYKPKQVIYDPIVFSSLNEVLMSKDVVSQIKYLLLPQCSLVIIKRRDAEYFLQKEINNADDIRRAKEELLSFGCKRVIFQEQILPQYTHGQGNNFSSAIATYLSKGMSLDDALDMAKSYISQQVALSSGLTGRGSELYNEFINEVVAHYRTNSDVHFYADCLNVSSRYLAQVTKRISGKAPKNIIDEYLRHEIELQLSTTDKTVQEIAYGFGFSSQAHFTKFFKKIEGQTPSQYRKNNNKK